MKTVAETTNGNVVGKVWYNDDMEQASRLVNASDISEIVGENVDEYETIEELNEALYGFSFTETPKY